MLALLTGASCSGKTTVATVVAGAAGLAVHDTDEDGVPPDADTAWRQLTLERWVRRAIELDAAGVDLLLTGQSPLGELLAVPSACDLPAAAVCLLDVDDDERRRRIEQREGGRWPAGVVAAQVDWGRWHRGHAGDPTDRPAAITARSWPDMRWSRWRSWPRGDRRWRVDVIDTTGGSAEAAAGRVGSWLARVRTERPNPFT